MLRITAHSTEDSITLKLEGKLSGPWVSELDQCWHAAKARNLGRAWRIDLNDVTFVDAGGKDLLARMYSEGAQLTAGGVMIKSVVEEIVARAKPASPGDDGAMNRKVLRGTLLILIPLLAACGVLRGQGPAPLRLTLSDAVQLALKQNPQVQIATLNVAESQQDHAIAQAALLPQVGFETYDKAIRFNLHALFGSPFRGFPQHIGPFQNFQSGIGFSIPIFDLTLWRRLQASHHGVTAAESQSTAVREQIVLLVVSQYLGSSRASAAVRAGQSRVELAQALYDQANDLQQHGVGTGIDTLRANVQLQNEKQGLIVAETQLKTSLYGLARLLNVDPGQPIELADQMRFFETPEFAASQSLEEALSTRPEMKALVARERAVSFQKKAAGESRLPSLKVGGGWAYQGLSAASSIPTYQYQATVDMPLFTGGQIHAQMTKADLELRKVGQEREDLRNQIALEVKTALVQLESARHEVDVANLGVKLSEEEVSQARDRFQAGVANNIEVISAQDALSRANDNQIAALYRYSQARADLAHAIGQIEQLYMK